MKAKLLILILFGLILKISAQKYYIPDSNLVVAIKASYPSVISGDSLIISEAQKVTGDINFSNKNIVNADGIQSEVSGFNSQINQFESLISIDVHGNSLTQLPLLPSNIEQILAFDNQLDFLLNLTNLDKLNYLHVSNNKLTELPHFSNFPNLTRLHCDQNQLTALNGLEYLTKIVDMFIWGNKITSIDSLSNNTTLARLYVYDNNLSSLPDFSNKLNMTKLLVMNNYLTFEDVYPLFGGPVESIISYSSMKPFEHGVEISFYDGQEIALQSQIDTLLSQVTYELFLNDTVSLAQNTSGSFKVSSPLFTTNDVLSIKIKSTLATALTISEIGWVLKKNECKNYLPDYISILNNDCSNGADIKLLHSKSGLNIDAVNYSFTAVNSSQTYDLDSTLTLENIPQGNYIFNAKLNNVCDVSKQFIVPNAPNCEYIFSPNNDGQNDSYYFDQSVEVKIYNTKGDCVKTLRGPIVWDGSDENGQIVPLGYYTIIINEKDLFHLTVMK